MARFKIDVKTKKGSRSIEKIFVSAGDVRKIMKFGVEAEKDMNELEVIESLVKVVVELFPEDKKLEAELWENYDIEELMDFCQDVLTLATGGKLDEGDKDSPSAE